MAQISTDAGGGSKHSFRSSYIIKPEWLHRITSNLLNTIGYLFITESKMAKKLTNN
jgi:hypothetical protein